VLVARARDGVTISQVVEMAQAVAREEPVPVAEDSQPASVPTAPAAAAGAAISAKTVKHLRDLSGAGMMVCKKALTETGGDVSAAQEWLRKKGMGSADKKAGRVAAEGVIASYIHAGARLGVMAEVNCETDFVARSEKFHEFANDVALQLAACEGLKARVRPRRLPLMHARAVRAFQYSNT
jgi:elongation factor Ts